MIQESHRTTNLADAFFCILSLTVVNYQLNVSVGEPMNLTIESDLVLPAEVLHKIRFELLSVKCLLTSEEFKAERDS